MSEKRVPPIKRGFWSRQFTGRGTRAQMVFDVAFGIVLPTLCFIIDASMLSTAFGFSRLSQVPYIDRIIPFAVFLEMGFLAIWLLSRKRLGAWNGLFAGPFMFGAICAGVVSLALLPLGIVAIILGIPIGILGLAPPLAAVVFFRNSIRAARADHSNSTGRMLGVGAIGLLVVAAASVGPAIYIENRLDTIYSHVIESGGNTTPGMKRFVRLWDPEASALKWAYIEARSAEDTGEAQRIANIYMSITGNDLEMETEHVYD